MKTFDLKVLNNDKFSMTSVLNKQRFEQLDRLLRANDLYTLAMKTRPPPISTPTNEFGHSPAYVAIIDSKYRMTPADNIANYEYVLTRLETVIYPAFDKALYHQSEGFIDNDQVLMYADMHAKFLHSQSVEIIGPEKVVELLKSLLVQDGGHREFVVVEDLEIVGLRLFSGDALVLIVLVVISRILDGFRFLGSS